MVTAGRHPTRFLIKVYQACRKLSNGLPGNALQPRTRGLEKLASPLSVSV